MAPTPIALSRRVTALKPSATLGVMGRAKALQRSGVDVLSFAAGEPDFDTPEVIKQAAIQALEAGQTKYAPTTGDPDTRKVIADKLTRENGLPGLTADHVTISAGGKHSLYLVAQCLLDPPVPGSSEAPEVLLPVPSWLSYAPIAQLAGGRVIALPTSPETAFKITPDQLRRAITPRSRLLFLNSPSNPCGTMYSEAELRALAAVVAEAARSTAPGLVIVTDEIYEKIVYGGIPHFSIGSIPDVAERTVTVNGLSKAFSMTGWRVGYAAASGNFGLALAKGIDTLQGQMTSNICSFVYPAIRTALTGCAADVERMRQAFAARAQLIYKLAGQVPGLKCVQPTGAFYLFPDVSAHFGRTSAGGKPIRTALDFAEALLSEVHVAVVPGEDFGGWGARCVRLSFACSEEQIQKGIERIARFVQVLK
jgi:aspartate aminotransferase